VKTLSPESPRLNIDMSLKKKIAVIGLKGLPAFGGAATVGQSLIEHLTQEFEFTVYSISSHADLQFDPPGYQQYIIKSFPIRKLNVFYYYLMSGIHAVFLRKYDVVHLHHIDGAFILSLLRRKYPVIVTSHARPQESEKWGWLARTLFNRNEKTVMRRASIVTVVSLKLRDYYKETYGRGVYYIPNGVTIQDNGPVTERGKHGDLVFAAGRIIPLKGCHTMLKSLIEIKYPGPVKIIGNIDQMPIYKKELLELSKDLDVEFMGLIREKTKLLEMIREAKFFIFPSYNENMSIMLLEAASVRTPIICSDIPENKVIFNHEEVLYFRSEDHLDLADKIKWADSNLDLMDKKSGKAYEKVLAVFTYEKISLEYQKLYDSLIS
jgi:glycosyltransferase involved in cell wall biosynthesis